MVFAALDTVELAAPPDSRVFYDCVGTPQCVNIEEFSLTRSGD
ncbi:MAG: hypothetical protein ABSA31_05290 [Acidimicrobiales bacterium]